MIRQSYLQKTTIALVLAGLMAITFSGCNDNAGGGDSGAPVQLNGAGATFPNPLYQKWFSEYNKANPNARFDYQSKGSGFGIQQIKAKTVDFAGSDAPMKDEDLKAASGPILHIPTVLGGVAVTYNAPDITGDLKLTPDALAGIYLGKIKKWNDPAIASANAGMTLPAKDITVVHRSDGSGTSFIFTDYLSKANPEWKEKVGANASVSWPAGNGANGSEGVIGMVKQTPYSIGYADVIYAVQQNLPVASIKNAAGDFVKPTLDSVTAAAAGSASSMPDDLRVSITNSPGGGAYPISSYTYLLVYQDQPDQAKGKALVKFLWWAIHDGEGFAKEKVYSPLPSEVVTKAEQKIKAITFQGKPLYTS